MIDFGTSQSPKSTRPLTTYLCPSRPGHQALRNNFASSLLLRTWLPYDWTPRSEAYFVFPLAQGTPGKQCGLAATGDYQPSLRSPWLAANEVVVSSVDGDITVDNCGDYMEALGEQLTDIDLDLLDSFF
ncbi:hypothetical protein, partial [Thiolapillus sp.]|uniref:hypothetical protein n=2 Tax=Thiolapillus sp. TaxID=2017437 RepID=UPI003AF8B252